MISGLTSHYLKLQYFAFIEHIVVSVQCPKLRHLRSVVRKISLKEHLSTLKVSDDLTAVHRVTVRWCHVHTVHLVTRPAHPLLLPRAGGPLLRHGPEHGHQGSQALEGWTLQ